MTFHTKSKRKVRGPKCPGRQNGAKSPRISVSLDVIDFHNIAWLAEQKGKPVAAVIRDALWAYLLPFRTNPALKLRPPP